MLTGTSKIFNFSLKKLQFTRIINQCNQGRFQGRGQKGHVPHPQIFAWQLPSPRLLKEGRKNGLDISIFFLFKGGGACRMGLTPPI